jgi:AAHS family 4-hydroxybenzoate transporter-like MFS transporter
MWLSSVFYWAASALAVGAVLLFALPESVRYLALRRPGDLRILSYARKLRPAAGFGSETQFVVEEKARTGVPLRHLFTEGRFSMTIYLWLALGFSFITHFFLSQWLTTLLTDSSDTGAARPGPVPAGRLRSFILSTRRAFPS